MKLSGFTLVRNGVLFQYPFIESIESALPLVDEFVVNVGYGDDSTLEEIRRLSQRHPHGHKLKIFESDWQLDNPDKKRSGKILSEQTNFALDRCSHDFALYLQADEVLHENDHTTLTTALQRFGDHPEVEGLLFDYLHFYGNYGVIQRSRSAYRREARLVRRSSGARSIGDAQSFRKTDGSKLKVVQCGARIFHYGWVRPPEVMKEKTFFFDQLYHGEPTQEAARTRTPHTGNNYRYKRFWGLERYHGDHPSVMQARIESQNWNWDLEGSPIQIHWSDTKKILLDTLERWTGVRLFEYRSYELISGSKPRMAQR